MSNRNDKNHFNKMIKYLRPSRIFPSYKSSLLGTIFHFLIRRYINKHSLSSKETYEDYVHDFLEDTKNEYQSRVSARKYLLIGLTIYVIIISFIVFYIILFRRFKLYLDTALIGGLFTNIVGLFAIVFKYAFNPSDKFYSFAYKIMQLEHEDKINKLKYTQNESSELNIRSNKEKS